MSKRRQSTAHILLGITLCITFFGSRSNNQTLNAQVGPQRPDIETIGLEDWVKEFSKLGITSFRNNELFMRAKSAGYYYVLVAPDEYSTDGATTSVTLRNISGTPSRFGYGIIFHSDTTPLKQDYAFLIDTVKKQFRAVRHSDNDETVIVPWTDCAFINSGRQDNTLEVRDRGTTTELFVNGHLVTTVDNTYAFKGGSPGLYTDTTNIAFRNFTIDHKAGLPNFK